MRKIILIDPNTMGSPLDKVVYTTQLFTFYLATEKPQMVVQLAMPGILCDNLSVPVTHNPLPVVLLGFQLHESCCDDTHTWSGESGCAGCFLLLVVLKVQEREMADPTGNERSPLVTAAVVKEDGVRV